MRLLVSRAITKQVTLFSAWETKNNNGVWVPAKDENYKGSFDDNVLLLH